MFHLIIINRNQNTMAQTKQKPRNPNVDRPATAVGSDVQPKRRTTSKQMSKKLPIKEENNPENTCYKN